jgi:hypothetical protein
MRFMMLIYPGLESEGDWTPDVEAVAAMGRYNEELTKAGVLLALDGLYPSSEGARISFADGKRVVTDGPFAETKELVGGYWIIQAKSKEEALEWAARCPIGGDVVLELRRIFELSDFPSELQEAAQISEPPPAQAVER